MTAERTTAWHVAAETASKPRAAISLLVADTQPPYRRGLALYIRQRSTLHLVAQSGDGRTALEQLRRLRPEVALLAVELPQLDALRLLKIVQRDALPTLVLLLCLQPAPGTLHDALARGASGAVTRLQPEAQICDAVEAVARGEIVLAPRICEVVASEVELRAHDKGPVITDREREILALLAAGKSPREIGEALHFATGTVSGHLHDLYRRLEVSGATAAVAEAIWRGLLD